MLTVLRMFVKVQWVELGGTDFLFSILRFDKDSNYLMALALDKVISEETIRVLRN